MGIYIYIYIIYFKVVHWYIVITFLDTIQYNGCQKEEHLMDINIASLRQTILSSNNQKKHFLLNVISKESTRKCIVEKAHINGDSMTNTLPSRKL